MFVKKSEKIKYCKNSDDKHWINSSYYSQIFVQKFKKKCTPINLTEDTLLYIYVYNVHWKTGSFSSPPIYLVSCFFLYGGISRLFFFFNTCRRRHRKIRTAKAVTSHRPAKTEESVKLFCVRTPSRYALSHSGKTF